MDKEKIKACMVSLSDDSSALENLKRVILSCTDPPIILSKVFTAVSDRPGTQDTIKAIDRLKPELVFMVLSSGHLKQDVFFIDSLIFRGHPHFII